MSKLSIDPVDIEASFDVVALYPSIPIPKALECVRRRLLNDTTLKERTDWKPDNIMKLLEICLETHFKTIDSNIYTQLDGTPIGKSISGPIEDLFNIWFEELGFRIFHPIGSGRISPSKSPPTKPNY